MLLGLVISAHGSSSDGKTPRNDFTRLRQQEICAVSMAINPCTLVLRYYLNRIVKFEIHEACYRVWEGFGETQVYLYSTLRKV
jgi:hypothetical protein